MVVYWNLFLIYTIIFEYTFKPAKYSNEVFAMTEDSKQSWWQTLPGILTALAATITALGGLLAVLYQAGIIGHHTEVISNAGVEKKLDAPMKINPPTSQSANIESSANAESYSKTTSKISAAAKLENILSAENGGHLVIASSDEWLGTIDGKEAFNQLSYGLRENNSVVFGFKDEKSATLEMFTVFINATADNNIKEFELFISNDSPNGPFESIGKFQTTNAKLFKTPYQEFKFNSIVAKYLKLKLISTYSSDHPNLMEIQMFGRIN